MNEQLKKILDKKPPTFEEFLDPKNGYITEDLYNHLVKKEQPTMITITLAEYNMLNERDFWLNCLENAGVDNWEGFDFACDLRDEYLNE